jgi:hypothetical protein
MTAARLWIATIRFLTSVAKSSHRPQCEPCRVGASGEGRARNPYCGSMHRFRPLTLRKRLICNRGSTSLDRTTSHKITLATGRSRRAGHCPLSSRKASLTVSGSNVGSQQFTEKIDPDRQKSQTGRQKGRNIGAFQRINSNRTLRFRIKARRAWPGSRLLWGPIFQLGRRARNDGCGRVLGVMRLATKH